MCILSLSFYNFPSSILSLFFFVIFFTFLFSSFSSFYSIYFYLLFLPFFSYHTVLSILFSFFSLSSSFYSSIHSSFCYPHSNSISSSILPFPPFIKSFSPLFYLFSIFFLFINLSPLFSYIPSLPLNIYSTFYLHSHSIPFLYQLIHSSLSTVYSFHLSIYFSIFYYSLLFINSVFPILILFPLLFPPFITPLIPFLYLCSIFFPFTNLSFFLLFPSFRELYSPFLFCFLFQCLPLSPHSSSLFTIYSFQLSISLFLFSTIPSLHQPCVHYYSTIPHSYSTSIPSLSPHSLFIFPPQEAAFGLFICASLFIYSLVYASSTHSLVS